MRVQIKPILNFLFSLFVEVKAGLWWICTDANLIKSGCSCLSCVHHLLQPVQPDIRADSTAMAALLTFNITSGIN